TKGPVPLWLNQHVVCLPVCKPSPSPPRSPLPQKPKSSRRPVNLSSASALESLTSLHRTTSLRQHKLQCWIQRITDTRPPPGCLSYDRPSLTRPCAIRASRSKRRKCW